MPTPTARTWAFFRLVRILVFCEFLTWSRSAGARPTNLLHQALSTILSMGFTAIYSVLLWRGWNLYSTEQRTSTTYRIKTSISDSSRHSRHQSTCNICVVINYILSNVIGFSFASNVVSTHGSVAPGSFFDFAFGWMVYA